MKATHYSRVSFFLICFAVLSWFCYRGFKLIRIRERIEYENLAREQAAFASIKHLRLSLLTWWIDAADGAEWPKYVNAVIMTNTFEHRLVLIDPRYSAWTNWEAHSSELCIVAMCNEVGPEGSQTVLIGISFGGNKRVFRKGK
jgi:hypothetical protein